MQIDQDKLKTFYGDKHMMEAVYTTILLHLDKIALDKVYSGQDASGIPLAKAAVDDMLLELNEKYGPKKAVQPKSIR